jgi:hypothetical protein
MLDLDGERRLDMIRKGVYKDKIFEIDNWRLVLTPLYDYVV